MEILFSPSRIVLSKNKSKVVMVNINSVCAAQSGKPGARLWGAVRLRGGRGEGGWGSVSGIAGRS